MGQSFSQQTLKTNTKMAISRMALVRSKKQNLLQIAKREVATLLSQEKFMNAEVKAESIIHEEKLLIASEILELHCQRLESRVAQIASQAKCPEDIFISIATIIYCSTRLPIPEFKSIMTQMELKYTKAWVIPLKERKQYVDPKVLELIDVSPPLRAQVIERLVALAKEFDIEYTAPVVEEPPTLTNEPLRPEVENRQANRGTHRDAGPTLEQPEMIPPASKNETVDESFCERGLRDLDKQAASSGLALSDTDIAEFPDVPHHAPEVDSPSTPPSLDNQPAIISARVVGPPPSAPSPDDSVEASNDDIDDLVCRLHSLKR